MTAKVPTMYLLRGCESEEDRSRALRSAWQALGESLAAMGVSKATSPQAAGAMTTAASDLFGHRQQVFPGDLPRHVRVYLVDVPVGCMTSSSSVSPRETWPQSHLIRNAVARLLCCRAVSSDCRRWPLAVAWRECLKGGHSRQRRGFQLCGRFVARVAGRRIEQEMPGRQGRLLFAYLAVNRDRAASRDELIETLWPQGLPSAPDPALSALLSKLRRLLPAGALEGGRARGVELGGDARVDVEAARDGIHRAEALIAARDWYAAIGPTLVAHNIGQRRFLPGEEGAWIDELRRELEEIQVRSPGMHGAAKPRHRGS